MHLQKCVQRSLKTSAVICYRPYPKQKAFHDAGLLHQERLFLAGNQVGKSFAGACELAMHLTGIYPNWWSGRRLDRPSLWWAATNTEEMCEQNLKRFLFGNNTGNKSGYTGKRSLIPASLILNSAKGEFLVKHKCGDFSLLYFKSYAQGRESWQGSTLDGIWFDEEPPIDVYMEGLARTQKLDGMVMVTMTPLQGKTNLVRLFLKD